MVKDRNIQLLWYTVIEQKEDIEIYKRIKFKNKIIKQSEYEQYLDNLREFHNYEVPRIAYKILD